MILDEIEEIQPPILVAHFVNGNRSRSHCRFIFFFYTDVISCVIVINYCKEMIFLFICVIRESIPDWKAISQLLCISFSSSVSISINHPEMCGYEHLYLFC